MMVSAYDANSRKRAVNLTLNEDLVARARLVTDNLSSLVESLLADFLTRQQAKKLAKAELARSTAERWNRFNTTTGSISDAYSTL
jgi:antitoxin CcdA